MNLELRSVTKKFKDEIVLENICFKDNIESLAIIGPSGGGKSTLLRIIGGLLAPDSGEMYIDNVKTQFNPKHLQEYRKNIGFVFQTKGLFEHLTAMENVTLPLIHAMGIPKELAIEKATKLFNRFGLGEDQYKYPFQLSGGQQQRISIARAVAVNPRVLLLDEPTSSLDPEYTGEVLNMLGELQKDGMKTIIVTHEMGFAKNACKKLIYLADNKIVESGLSSQLFQNPKSDGLKAFLDKILEWKI